MLTEIDFQGFSDDLIHVTVNGVTEEYCDARTIGTKIPFLVKEKGNPEDGGYVFIVNAFYGLNGGTWCFAIEQSDEDDFMPNMITTVSSRKTHSPYSTILTITLTGKYEVVKI